MSLGIGRLRIVIIDKFNKNILIVKESHEKILGNRWSRVHREQFYSIHAR